MFLAFKEMSRAKVRFALLIAAIGLLVFLILFQQSLQNGLITAFVGAIRDQTAPVLVYSVDGQRTSRAASSPRSWRRRSAPPTASGPSARSARAPSPGNPAATPTGRPSTPRSSATNWGPTVTGSALRRPDRGHACPTADGEGGGQRCRRAARVRHRRRGDAPFPGGKQIGSSGSPRTSSSTSPRRSSPSYDDLRRRRQEREPRRQARRCRTCSASARRRRHPRRGRHVDQRPVAGSRRAHPRGRAPPRRPGSPRSSSRST